MGQEKMVFDDKREVGPEDGDELLDTTLDAANWISLKK